MLNEARLTKISKFLSKYLRHEPEKLGLTLAVGGWVEVDKLLAGCQQKNFSITRAELDEVVERNSKKRFSFDETGTLIRANQGHSVEVDLQLSPVEPPARLYHGTATRNLDSILQTGIEKRARHHVHLSKDVETAVMVGQRYGKPVVLLIDAAAMQQAGITFYCSDNGVWLVDCVPPEYLSKLS